jgi:hypothetical protein
LNDDTPIHLAGQYRSRPIWWSCHWSRGYGYHVEFTARICVELALDSIVVNPGDAAASLWQLQNGTNGPWIAGGRRTTWTRPHGTKSNVTIRSIGQQLIDLWGEINVVTLEPNTLDNVRELDMRDRVREYQAGSPLTISTLSMIEPRAMNV